MTLQPESFTKLSCYDTCKEHHLMQVLIKPCRIVRTLSIRCKTRVLFVGGAVASWLVRSTPERAVRVRALAGDIVLCSWARHFTYSASLHPGV